MRIDAECVDAMMRGCVDVMPVKEKCDIGTKNVPMSHFFNVQNLHSGAPPEGAITDFGRCAYSARVLSCAS